MIRADKRKADELREIEIKAGIIPNAFGSGYVKMGKTIAIAGVYGPREFHPKSRLNTDRAVIRCIYTMLPFSTLERARPGPSRRSVELSKVIRHALEPAVFLEEFPRAAIDIYIDILQADSGTRTAAINAASVALADAGIPMRDLVISVAGGKLGDECAIDLTGQEEEETLCDLPIAYMPNLKKLTLIQMDGDIPFKDLEEIIKLNIKACEKIYKLQRGALEKRYGRMEYESAV